MFEIVDSTPLSNNGVSRASPRRSSIFEPSSMYFLHYSDSHGLILVSLPLIGDNYTSWSRVMLIALCIKNKISFVDGSLPRPQCTNLDLLNSWMRNNNIVISWILNLISKKNLCYCVICQYGLRDLE